MTFKHGLSGTKAYKVWKSMRDRCLCPTHHAWPRYGGRGIAICPEWDDFMRFYADMGDPPPGLSLERRDNDGPYSAVNCKWATRKAQQNNLRTNVLWTFAGKTQTLQQWSEEFGIKYKTLWDRVFRRGWSVERALGA